MFRKLHRRGGEEVWVNLDQVLLVTRVQGGGSDLTLISRNAGTTGATPLSPQLAASQMIRVLEHPEEIVGASVEARVMASADHR